jgi:DNA-binding CsgD family transcriptional regulator
MPIQKNTTWLDYIKESREQDFDPSLLKIEGLEKFFGISTEINTIFQHSIPSIYLLDYTSGKYVIFSQNIESTLGLKRDFFDDGGIDFTISQYHKDDLRLYSNSIFPDRINFLKNIPPAEHAQYVFSYNYRLKNQQGKYCSLLQRNTFIRSDANGKPLLSLGMVINIDHYKNPNTAVQLIEKVTGNDYAGEAQTILKKTYFLNDEDTLLTKRETELLKYLADGLSSKQIADKVFLSEHTVIVHRKNMMAKTNSGNIAELVSWAIRNEII